MCASPFYRMQFMMCAGTGCMASGSLEVRDALVKELAKRNLQDEVQIIMTGCNGFCAMGPLVVVYPDGIFYNQVKRSTRPSSWKNTCSRAALLSSCCSRKKQPRTASP